MNSMRSLLPAAAAIGLAGLVLMGGSSGVFLFGGASPAEDGDSSPTIAPSVTRTVHVDGASRGSFERTYDDFGWFHVAYRLTDELKPGDVEVNVTYVWGERDYQEGSQFWARGVHFWTPSPRPDRYKLRPPNTSPIINWVHKQNRAYNDAVVEVGVQVAGHGASVVAPNPCANVCYGNRTVERDPDRMQRYYDAIRNKTEDPVVHLLFAAGGKPPDRARVNISWKGTVLNWTRGGADDVFSYMIDDFRYRAFAQVDGPLSSHPRAGRDGSLTVDWTDPGPVWFWWAPPSGFKQETGEDNPSGYVRPDGTVQDTTGWPSWRELAYQEGRWRFWFDNAAEAAGRSLPRLVGTPFSWPELPVASGTDQG